MATADLSPPPAPGKLLSPTPSLLFTVVVGGVPLLVLSLALHFSQASKSSKGTSEPS